MGGKRVGRQGIAVVCSTMAGILWGTVPTATKMALVGLTPMEIAFYRGLFGYGALLMGYGVLGVVQGGAPVLYPRWRDLPKLLAISLTGMVVFWGLMNWGLALTTGINNIFLVLMYPILVAIFSPLLLGEELRRSEWLGVALSLIGIYLLMSNGQFLTFFRGETFTGDLLSLLSSFSFAGYLLLQRRHRASLLPSYATVNMMGLATFVLLLYALLFLRPLALLSAPARIWISVLWLGLFCSALCFLLINRALQLSRAFISAVPLFIAPVVGTVLAISVLHEGATLYNMGGGLLILLGILVAVWREVAGGVGV